MRSVVRALGIAAATWTCIFAVACGLPLAGLGASGGEEADGATPPEDASVDGSTPEEGGPGEGASDGSGADGVAPPDATSETGVDGSGVLASVGTVASPTGLSTGTHLVYATHAALWWLFWIDSTAPTTILTSHSPDFVTWTPGGTLPLTLSMNAQGGNFSVAYADVQGTDVVHLSIDAYGSSSPTRHHLHSRATIDGTTITFGSIDDISDIEDAIDTDPDGPATIVDSQGNVWDATGWANVGAAGPANETVCESTDTDQGTVWPADFGTQTTIFQAQGTVHSRAFATLGTGTLVAMCDSADEAPPSEQPTNVEWMAYGEDGWGAAATVFQATAGVTQDPNDWGAGTLQDGFLHVVRRQSTGTFDYERYDGTGWVAPGTPASDPLGFKLGSGVAVLASGDHMAVVTIANDAANSVRMAVWVGASWNPWTTLEGSAATRNYVSGWSGASNNAVLWTEGSGSDYVIKGRMVSF